MRIENRSFFEGNKQVSYNSKIELLSEMENSEIQVKVLGNSIGCIIALLAVLNYLNMMAAGVQNRSKEFAVLESIGMTEKQIGKMLCIEGAGYAIISIIISLLAGIPISYIVFNAVKLYRISFSIPWVSNLILFGIILVLCIATPVCIYLRTQNDSIIERIRNCED